MAQRDPFSWAADFANTQHQRATQESGDAQNALMSIFREEAARQRPYVDLPVDLARHNMQANADMPRRMMLEEHRQQMQQKYHTGGQGSSYVSGIPQVAALAEQMSTDLGIPVEAATGFLGELAYESNNFQTLQEQNPMINGSRGGFGWAQWTGPRRRAFEKFAADNQLDISSPAANYGFLIHELKTTPEGQVLDLLRDIRDPQLAAEIVRSKYLRPGIVNAPGRRHRVDQVSKKVNSNKVRRFVKETTGGGDATNPILTQLMKDMQLLDNQEIE